jgi:hypothetical protein
MRPARGIMSSSVQQQMYTPMPVVMLVFLGRWIPLMALNGVGSGAHFVFPSPSAHAFAGHLCPCRAASLTFKVFKLNMSLNLAALINP